MPAYELQKTTCIAHSGYVAAGTSAITPTTAVNAAGASAVRFIVKWGAITATGVQSAEVHQSSDDAVADAYTAILGTNVTVAATDDNKLTVIDILNPGEQYLKCIINRATANSVIDSIIALVVTDRSPSTHVAGSVQGYECHDSAAEGTA